MTTPRHPNPAPTQSRLEGLIAQLPAARHELHAHLGVSPLDLIEFARDLRRALKAHYAARALVDPAGLEQMATCETLDCLLIGALLAEARDRLDLEQERQA